MCNFRDVRTVSLDFRSKLVYKWVFDLVSVNGEILNFKFLSFLPLFEELPQRFRIVEAD